jgi:SAM-dependent methyltransferase
VSIAFYDQNSAAFFASTVDADMSAQRARFLALVGPTGSILDAGCGSGRDSLAFVRAGYAVTAFDGSSEMVRLASAHTGLAVHHLRFSDVSWRDVFDGIWACASLLHVPGSELPDCVSRLVRALRPGGVMFLSFKYGDGERWNGRRHFTDMTEASLMNLTEGVGLRVADVWQSNDVRPERRDERWIGMLARRA